MVLSSLNEPIINDTFYRLISSCVGEPSDARRSAASRFLSVFISGISLPSCRRCVTVSSTLCAIYARSVNPLNPVRVAPLDGAGEEGAFEGVELVRDVVVAVEVAVVEDMGEDLLGQHVLDRHLAHVGLGQRRVDGRSRGVVEEAGGGVAEAGVAA